MNRTHTDEITLGRNVTLTFDVLNAIAARARRQARRTARRERWIARLAFWKRLN